MNVLINALSHIQWTALALYRYAVKMVIALLSLGLVHAAIAVESAPPELRIGFQKSAVNLVILKQQGALEKAFPQTKVKWVEFPAGPQILEALSVGSLELGFTGDTPPVFAQAAGKPLYYIGSEPPKPRGSAILVLADSKLHSLSDLKGKKIAFQKGSSAHFLVIRALKKAGLTWADIQPIYLAPADARAAFERGSVDAWAIWDPYYAATQVSIKARPLADGRGLSDNNSFYLASKPLVEKYPQSIKTILKSLSVADEFVQSNRLDAVKYISNFSGLDQQTVTLFLSRRPPSPATPVPVALIANQQSVADSFQELGLIPAKIQVADLVWKPTH